MELLVLIFPLLAFIYLFLNPFQLYQKMLPWVAVGSVGSSAILSVYCVTQQLTVGPSIVINLGTWINFSFFHVDFLFLIDALTSIMFFTVTVISFLVHLYSVDYMSDDPQLILFMSFLSLFTFCMLVLVAAGNFVVMFLGWEGVGISSYLLINFWRARLLANKSAVKAVLLNRIGDVFIFLSMALLWQIFHTLDYHTIFALAPFAPDIKIFDGVPLTTLDFACLALLIGGVAKSAQIGLHTWLPDQWKGLHQFLR